MNFLKTGFYAVTFIVGTAYSVMAVNAEIIKVPSCAVLNLKEGQGIDKGISSQLSARLTVAAEQTGRYTMIPRLEVSRKLNELQQSAVSIPENSTDAVKTGRAIKAEFVIYGKVWQEGLEHYLETYLVDVNNSKVLGGTRTKFTGYSEEFVSKAPVSNIRTLFKASNLPDPITAKSPELATTEKPLPLPEPKAEEAPAASTKQLPQQSGLIIPEVGADPRISDSSPKNLPVTTTNIAQVVEIKPAPEPEPPITNAPVAVVIAEAKPAPKPIPVPAAVPEPKETIKPANPEPAPITTAKPISEEPKPTGESSALAYLKNLRIGTGFSVQMLLKDTKNTFFGSIDKLEVQNTIAPLNLFADWQINESWAVNVAWNHLEAKTITTVDNNKTDGDFVLDGPSVTAIYVFNPDDKIRYHAGAGIIYYMADFEESTWWGGGFDSPEMWIAMGQPEKMPNGYERHMELNNPFGLRVMGGVTYKINEKCFCGADAELNFVEVEDNFYSTLNGSFYLDMITETVPLDYLAVKLYAGYDF